MMTAMGVVGAVVVIWFGVRLIATGVDVAQRWRAARRGDDSTAWP
jgi:hypothetical protein